MSYIQKKKLILLTTNAQIQKSNNFLNNIKIPSVLPSLISGETITNIAEKVILLTNFLLPSVLY